jgi:Na+/alanine symporter
MRGECAVNSNLINIIQFMFLIICFTSILSYAVYTYNKFKHKFEKNIVNKVLLQWIDFVKTLLPDQYIIYEKYGIWRYVERLKMKMMF